MARLLDRCWFGRDAPVVAPELLNKLLVVTNGAARCSGRIIETEAYMPDDAASHTFKGATRRNAVMFGPPGYLYVYLSYGIHNLINVVTGSVGSGQAVLLRAVDVIEGIETVRARRGGVADRDLTNGPGKVGQALGINLSHNGLDALQPDASVRLCDDGTPPPEHPIVGPRIGISKGVDTLWRFRVPSR